jgi:hypothetical protein
MRYAVFNNDGEIIIGPKVIPPSEGLSPHSEMMPKMVFKPDGEIIAVWPVNNPSPDNPFSGLTYYAQSFDEGESWTDPIPITTDTASNDQRYFDVAVLPDGNAGIVWLDDRIEYPNGGSNLFYAETVGNKGFQNEKIIGRSTCQCCRTDLYVDPSGYINVVYRNIFGKMTRDMAYTVSKDQGDTFSNPKRISADNWEIMGCPHTGPTMTSFGKELMFYWYTLGGGEGVYTTSTDNYGRQFAERKLFSDKARHPQITSLEAGTVALVWDEKFHTTNGDRNRIGLMLRNEKNGLEEKRYITPESVNAYYPVVLGLSEQRLAVAWWQEGEPDGVYVEFIDR